MRKPYFRTSLVSSVLALVIALSPASAMVNADTATPSAPTTSPKSSSISTDPGKTTPPVTPSAPTKTDPPASVTQPSDSKAPSPTTNAKPSNTHIPSTSPPSNGPPAQSKSDEHSPALSQPDDKTAAKAPETYSYNSETHKWDTTTWHHDPSSDKYVPAETESTSLAPETAKTALTTLPQAVAVPPLSTTDPNTLSPSGAVVLNNNTTAKTGDATADTNTHVGNVTTGDANAIANRFNLLRSSASFAGSNGQLAVFNKDIQGDVTGDILIDPSKLGTLTAANNPSPTANITVASKDSGDINNNLSVDATSGNATSTHNKTVGNTTSGNANAVANVVNLVNSTIGAGQSFLGNINIYGNLNGDILLPPGFLDSLLASNTPNTTMPLASEVKNPSTPANLANTQSITNKTNLTAATGNVNVSDNTRAGNAASGDALTNLTVMNLTGHDVIGTNDLLVFVNVLGKWYGVIMNAPSGTTAAEVGGGIKNSQTIPLPANSAIDAPSTNNINNNITARARSGDATLASNTHAGNARSGNATASINLANFINSHLSLSDWFGVLFINVFGTWTGSFGRDTAAGNPPAANPANADSHSNTRPDAAQTRVFKFVPGSGNDRSKLRLEPVDGAARTTPPSTPTLGNNTSGPTHAVLAGVTNSNTTGKLTTTTNQRTAPSAYHPSWIVPVGGLSVGMLLLAAERALSLRRRK